MAIMKELVATLLVACLFHLVRTTPLEQSESEANATEDNDMMKVMLQGDEPQMDTEASEYANQIIEGIKARILKNLNRKEPPKKHVPLSPLQTFNFRNDSEVDTEATNGTTNSNKGRRSAFVYANVANYGDSNGSLVLFHFDLPQQVVNKDFESAELWLHKKKNITEFSISWVIANGDAENETLTAIVRNQELSENWIRFNVSRMLATENISSLDLQISSEDGQWGLEFEGNSTPFLIILTEDRAISKRSLDCPSDNSSCCRENFMVNFTDTSWGEWVVYPKIYDAKICKGDCTTHHGLPWKHHGRIMLVLCQKHQGLASALEVFGKQGGCVSCQPIEYEPFSFIYLTEDKAHVVQKMSGMVISKCGCL